MAPTVREDAWEQVLPWKCVSAPFVLDEVPVCVIELVRGAEPAWDWRTVAFWQRALRPGWRVYLRHPGRVDLKGIAK